MSTELIILLEVYKKANRKDRKNRALKKLIAVAKSDDLLYLMDEANKNSIDLSFGQIIIDEFFNNLDLKSEDLLNFYLKVQGKIFENYFIGNLYRKNIGFKDLENFCLKIKGKNNSFEKIIAKIMLSTSVCTEDLILILCRCSLDIEIEKDILKILRKHSSQISFWAKAYERSVPKSTLNIYAENYLKKIISRKQFNSIYRIYEEYSEQKVAEIFLNELAKIANTENQINKVLYVSSDKSLAYIIAFKKKKQLTY